ncbi:hypothetical protein DMENIID0001_026460 [Sergentomyia squamirostris]
MGDADGINNVRKDVAELKSDNGKMLRALALLQTSVDSLAQTLTQPSLELPIRTEEYLHEVEEKLQSRSDRQLIISQLRQVLPGSGNKWLEKVIHPDLLMEYTVNNMSQKENSKSLLDLGIVELCQVHAKKTNKSDLVYALARVKDRVKQGIRRKQKKTARQSDTNHEISDLEVPHADLNDQENIDSHEEINTARSQQWGLPK